MSARRALACWTRASRFCLFLTRDQRVEVWPFENQLRDSALVTQLDHPFPAAHGAVTRARRRGRVIELADFQCVVDVCL
jgi:hypothetical protein